MRELIYKLYKDALKTQNSSNFYTYIVEKLEDFIKVIKSTERDDLCTSLNKSKVFNGETSKQRFINLLNHIKGDLLRVLRALYKGDIYNACINLNNCLFGKKYARWLIEPYHNYLTCNLILKEKNFFRMRDDINVVRDCWHVPFEQRYKVQVGRYNLAGFPCLYLSNSLITADKECGTLEQGKHRFFSIFTITKKIGVYDLKIPSKNEIEKMEDYDIIQKILIYPLTILCSTQYKNKTGNFHEEYFIPQLLSHNILMGYNKNTEGLMVCGIKYSSTKNIGGYNIVFPAISNVGQDHSSCLSLTGHSKFLKEHLHSTEPLPYQKLQNGIFNVKN